MDGTEWNPGKLLEVSGSYWKACALHAAVKLGVFTVIGAEELSGGEVARKLNGDERGVTMLLNALVAMNLLVRADDKYSNTSAGLSFLSKTSPEYIGHMIMHHHHLVDSWFQLDQAVKTGKPVRKRASYSDEEWRESFLMGMFNLAMNLAPRLVAGIDISDRRHLLDLGGGPGTYAIHFCLNNPRLKATVYDLPTTRPFAEKTIERFGLSDRIDFVNGDYLEEGVEGVYDVAWLSHILHGEGPEDAGRLIRKAVSVLEPGGMIIIHDFILNDTMDGPLFPALFSLNMLLGTARGQSYSEKQIMDMLAGSGVREIRRTAFQGPNDSGVIIGIV
ncbi:MAG: methyltransferase domain-containing protein [Deltaproteobacteria bacterium]|nr:MAG: methyltransferase domain-containing protein [Deltaproteobacteria bacterium]